MRIAELQQGLESSREEVTSLRDAMSRLQAELATLQCDLAAREAELQAARETNTEVSHAETEEVEADEAAEQLRQQLSSLQEELLREKERHALCSDMLARVEAEMESTKRQHEELEARWTSGLKSLREEEARSREEARVAAQRNAEALERAEAQSREGAERFAEAEARLKTVQDNHRATIEVYEKERSQLRDAAAAHRNECQVAQERVLQIHKEMLCELKSRDEQARESEATRAREAADLRSQVADLQHDRERVKEALDRTKKRCAEIGTSRKSARR